MTHSGHHRMGIPYVTLTALWISDSTYMGCFPFNLNNIPESLNLLKLTRTNAAQRPCHRFQNEVFHLRLKRAMCKYKGLMCSARLCHLGALCHNWPQQQYGKQQMASEQKVSSFLAEHWCPTSLSLFTLFSPPSIHRSLFRKLFHKTLFLLNIFWNLLWVVVIL